MFNVGRNRRLKLLIKNSQYHIGFLEREVCKFEQWPTQKSILGIKHFLPLWKCYFLRFALCATWYGRLQIQVWHSQRCSCDVITWIAPSSVQSEPTSVMLCWSRYSFGLSLESDPSAYKHSGQCGPHIKIKTGRTAVQRLDRTHTHIDCPDKADRVNPLYQ